MDNKLKFKLFSELLGRMSSDELTRINYVLKGHTIESILESESDLLRLKSTFKQGFNVGTEIEVLEFLFQMGFDKSIVIL